jgi:prolyl oligopeptidase
LATLTGKIEPLRRYNIPALDSLWEVSLMRPRRFFFLSFIALAATVFAQAPHAPAPMEPPKTQVHDVREMMHGVEIVDPYRWLEDQNSPETRKWIAAENEYSDSLLNGIPGTDALKNKVAALLKVETMTTPVVRGGRYFFTRRGPDQDQSSLCVRNGLSGKDELLVDPEKLSPQHNITVVLSSVSRDGGLIVYGLRHGGEDEIAPHLYDVNANRELADQLPKGRYNGIALLPDKSGIYYSRQTKEGPRVYFHKIGTSADADTEVFGKGYGPETLIHAAVSLDGHYLIIEVSYGSAAEKTEVYFQDLNKKGPIVAVVDDLTATFFPSVAGDKMYLVTDWQAPRRRLLEVDLKNPARQQWRELLPQEAGVLEGISVVGNKIIARYTRNVITRLKVFTPEGQIIRLIEPPALGSLSSLSGTWDSTEGFYTFNSFYIAPTIYRYDVASGKQSVWFQAKVPIQANQYEVRQVWYSSKDGTRIPMFVAHAKGIKLDGSHPTLLTGYGGFDIAENPAFNAFSAAWISSGGVYALANLRGGSEFGEAWHHAGMREKKQNVFNDFIAAAEWLIKNKYTSQQRLAIRGTSNGGLLVGAALTQRPDLFAAVICGYPLLDMLRYDKFLVARYWVPEYGTAENANDFKFIYAYSPYQHVKRGTKYPAVLFLTGDSDTRVAPLHARKMTALLQASTGSDKPILLHYDTDAGHSGGAPVSKQIENTTRELSFLMWQLGMTREDPSGHK